MAKWDHLRASVPMILSMSIAGLGYAGADIGGFFFEVDPTMFVKWYQLGVFYPFMRGHAHEATSRREPWLFEDNIKNEIRSAIIMRYRLLPYVYSTFYEHSTKGTPIMRPMMFEFPEDSKCSDLDEQFMFGSGLMVKP
jgi:alpha 1,3-glucosidase